MIGNYINLISDLESIKRKKNTTFLFSSRMSHSLMHFRNLSTIHDSIL